MSRTKGQVIDKEHYPTPINVVKTLMKEIYFRKGDIFLEPCRAEGNIYDHVPLPEDQKVWAEIRHGVDYLKTSFNTVDVIITNPPFSLTEDFLRKAFSEIAYDGTIIFLQRVNFLGSIKRVPFWKEMGFPQKYPILVPRPRFVNGGSDSCEYMWMIWDFGDRLPNTPEGLSHIITIPNE